jgi:hypothetical protein
MDQIGDEVDGDEAWPLGFRLGHVFFGYFLLLLYVYQGSIFHH